MVKKGKKNGKSLFSFKFLILLSSFFESLLNVE